MFYGGSIIGFMASFGLARAIAQLMAWEAEHFKGTNHLGDTAFACKTTGFLPLHVAIANGLTGMYDFLLEFKGLPLETQIKLHALRADPNASSARGEARIELCNLTALQLAVKLGNKRLFWDNEPHMPKLQALGNSRSSAFR